MPADIYPAPKANPNISQMPSPTAAEGSLLYVVQALKQAVDSLAGFRGPATARAVTFDDLVRLNLVDSANVASATGSGNTGGGGGSGGTGGSAGVVRIDTDGGAHGGPITSRGTITTDWDAGPVVALGSHMSLLGGVLNALADWQAGYVTTVGTGLSLTGGILSATATGGGGTITGVWAPTVTGELPGPVLIATPDGECVMAPIT